MFGRKGRNDLDPQGNPGFGSGGVLYRKVGKGKVKVR